jgi:hypothetical protein
MVLYDWQRGKLPFFTLPADYQNEAEHRAAVAAASGAEEAAEVRAAYRRMTTFICLPSGCLACSACFAWKLERGGVERACPVSHCCRRARGLRRGRRRVQRRRTGRTAALTACRPG